MKDKELNVIVIKRWDRELITIELKTIKDNLKVYYDLIGCRAIDITGRYFGGVHFTIVLDDEGLLVANERNELPTSWWQNENYTPNHEGLFGVLVLCHSDEKGNLTSATFEDIIAVHNCYKVIPTNKGNLGLLFHEVEQ